MSSILSNGAMMSRKSNRVNYMGLKILKREAGGLERVRSEQSNPLKTSSLFIMKKAISLLIFRQNLNGHWLRLVWSLESVFAVQYMHVLHFVRLCFQFFVDRVWLTKTSLINEKVCAPSWIIEICNFDNQDTLQIELYLIFCSYLMFTNLRVSFFKKEPKESLWKKKLNQNNP
jgi:hypothetical protein